MSLRECRFCFCVTLFMFRGRKSTVRRGEPFFFFARCGAHRTLGKPLSQREMMPAASSSLSILVSVSRFSGL